MLFTSILYLFEIVAFGAALHIQPRDVNGTNSTEPTKPRIYFIIMPFGGVKASNYQHMPVALAEGLADAGYYFRANLNYWNQTLGGPYLFKNTTESPVNFDAVVVTYRMVEHIPAEVLQANKMHGKPKLVCVDWGDGHHMYFGSQHVKFDIYYRAHYTEAYMPAKPRKPLLPSALYLTKRIIMAANAAESRRVEAHRERERKYMWPHKTIMHPVRHFMQEHLLDNLAPEFIAKSKREKKSQSNADFYYWSMTGGRHDSNFYDLMQNSQAMDCTAGHWHNNKLFQWDSFKLWEAFGSSIAVVLPDLELYGMKFPVMPKKFVHYIPAVLQNESLKTLAKNITSDLDLVKIGKAGHEWALEHYGPAAFARRFMKDVFPHYSDTLEPLDEEVYN